MYRFESIRTEVDDWIQFLLSLIPGRVGVCLRRRAIPFKRIGEKTFILELCRFYHAQNISIGKNCGIGSRTVMNGAAGIEIGNDVVIGPGVYIWTQNHKYQNPDIPIRLQGWDFAPVIIEDDVWLGAGVRILPGVHIGKGSVVGVSSVVTKNIPPYSIVLGFPARKIGMRGKKDRDN